MTQPLPSGRLIVAIDGPAGAGKSTVARSLARRLGLEFLDTGAMYRAAAAVVLDRGVDPEDERAVADLVRDARLHFDWAADPPALIAFDASIMPRLRDADVSALVSPLSAQPALRRAMVDLQRRIGDDHPRLVTEGRDQGTIVFPDADVKIYLDASVKVRAGRRADQIREVGRAVDVAAIEAEIHERDRLDSTRPVGPLVRSPDAIYVDSSGMNFDVVVAELERIVRESICAAGVSAGRSPSA